MTLTLSIRNVDRLDNGMPTEFVLNRRGAVIGRAATCDWSLPDPRNYISSRHGEVLFRDGFYLFNDLSTNGTFLNGVTERMSGARRIEQGDLFLIGHYEVTASLSGEGLAAVERHSDEAAQEADRQGGWGWEAAGGGAPAAPVQPTDGWGDTPANAGPGGGRHGAAAPLGGGWGAPGGDTGWDAPVPAASDGWGTPPASDGWGPPPSTPDQANWAPQAGPSLNAAAPYASRGAASSPPSSGPIDSGNSWAPAPRAAEERAPSPWDPSLTPAQPSSAWSSAAPDRPRTASPNDIWGSMENSNVVDWARANFGAKPEAASDPLGLNKRPADALPKELPRAPVLPSGGGGQGIGTTPPTTGWGTAPTHPVERTHPTQSAPASMPAPQTATPSGPPPAPVMATAPGPTELARAFVAAAGLRPDQLKQPPSEVLARAGDVLRRLVSGLVVMVEARARAKSQLGAEQTSLQFDGNNPLKFARTPEQAMAALLGPPERGFMDSDKAIEDAYRDLQSHQMATLKAMQGALRATLDRFSPEAIKKRAETGGFLARLLPGGREATLWATYEREFSGVAQGSDEAFMDVFAKEFRQAYEAQSRSSKRG